VYNDAVNDPKIKKWLGQVVGKEGEDLSRHDKWLCMMYPRLKLLHRLLADDGAMFVSIDDDEVHTLRCLLDEIFGRSQRLATFVWRTDGNFDNQAKIKNCHEYVLMYCKNPELFLQPPVIDPSVKDRSKLFRPIIRNTIVKNGPKNPESRITIPAGFPADFECGTIKTRENAWPKYFADCVVENGQVVIAVDVESGWSSLSLLQEFIDKDYTPVIDTKGQETTFVMTSTGAIETIKQRGRPSHVITTLSGLGSTQSMSVELADAGIGFDYPKPVDFVSYLLSMIDNRNCLVLDSFAGSGTTAHAVLKLNAQDGGNRRFILVETMDYAETITAERVRRVMGGYGEGNKAVTGLGGSFDYYTVGERLLLDDGMLNPAVGLSAIRDYVAWTEGIPIGQCAPLAPMATEGNASSPSWMGEAHGLGLFFVWDDTNPTTLDLSLLTQLVKRPGRYLIYADQCALGEDFMRRHNIVYKKIPRDITRL